MRFVILSTLIFCWVGSVYSHTISADHTHTSHTHTLKQASHGLHDGYAPHDHTLTHTHAINGGTPEVTAHEANRLTHSADEDSDFETQLTRSHSGVSRDRSISAAEVETLAESVNAAWDDRWKQASSIVHNHVFEHRGGDADSMHNHSYVHGHASPNHHENPNHTHSHTGQFDHAGSHGDEFTYGTTDLHELDSHVHYSADNDCTGSHHHRGNNNDPLHTHSESTLRNLCSGSGGSQGPVYDAAYDVDNDGDVDNDDLSAISSHFGSTDPGDLARYDVDGDGDIDTHDYQRAARNLGATSSNQGSNTQTVIPEGTVFRDGVVHLQSVVVNEPVPEDVDGDGDVDNDDLIAIAWNLREIPEGDLARYDVDGDGDIDNDDFYAVRDYITQSANTAPPAASLALHLERIKGLNIADPDLQPGVQRFKRRLPVEPAPKKTVLLANYPNPFNPETWIPYRLAKAADVTLTIYAASGEMVRSLTVGHQPAGNYVNRARAAYWDGKNGYGEPVGSGVYFYSLITDDFSATRKMLIAK